MPIQSQTLVSPSSGAAATARRLPSPPPGRSGRRPRAGDSPERSFAWRRDAELVRRISGGDAAALQNLYDRYAPELLGFLALRVGRSGMADEVLQETFLQAWREAGRYNPGVGSPRTWLYMLARSRAVDALRANGARRRRERSYAGSQGGGPVSEPTGTASLEAHERSLRVRRALRSLPAEQRQCLELAFWGELSHRQVAERLRQPLGTVKSRILLGLRKLRREMAA